MKKPCNSTIHFGFVIATSSNSQGQFNIARELVDRIFKHFAVTGSKAGATTLQPVTGSERYFKDSSKSLRQKLDSLPNHSGTFTAAQLATSIEEAVLQMSVEAPRSSNKLIVLFVDVKDFDMTSLDTIAPLTRRELVMNNIKLFIIALGSVQKSSALKSLTAYPDEVVIKQRLDSVLNGGLETSIALSICQVICECYYTIAILRIILEGLFVVSTST